MVSRRECFHQNYERQTLPITGALKSEKKADVIEKGETHGFGIYSFLCTTAAFERETVAYNCSCCQVLVDINCNCHSHWHSRSGKLKLHDATFNLLTGLSDVCALCACGNSGNWPGDCPKGSSRCHTNFSESVLSTRTA